MTKAWRMLALALLLAVSAIGPASTQQDIVGVASVIDGDTIEILGQRIRLFGIDASEGGQLCVRPNGERWRCAQQSSLALADRIGRATVRCESRDIDRYRRVVAVCFKGTEDLTLDGGERLGRRIPTIFGRLRRRRGRRPTETD
jgi:endonuclease YncB( thermonuclease family)